jgi:isoquinoline 1-oxidoreductase beta subunit
VSAPETSRRRFLVGSASLLGGVAFGVVACREAAAPTAAAPAPPQPVSLTPFVTIDADGITLITPRTEMGQGIASTQAYLIAEELDVDPLSCRISPGMPDKVYYNAAVADALAPVPEYDHSDEAEAVREKGQAAFRKGGLQVTGGSTSIPDMFHRLRETGALARDTLKRAAADVTGVPVGELRTEDGHVWTPDGRKLAYTELAAAAASLTPGPTPTLRTPDQWRYLGKAIPRTDMAAKSTGTLEFGIDVAFDDMLYATVKTHPAWGGTMLGYDAAEAEAMPGVHAVVPLDGGVGIVADRTWTAFSAMKTVRFDWGPGPYPKSTAEMWPVLEAAVGDPALLEGVMRDDGDVDAVLAEAGDAVLRAEYRAPYLAHAALEPMNAVVKVTDTRVDVWTGTQIPAFVQAHVATVLEVPAEIVFVHNRPMGGSFGRRLEDEAVKQAALVARAAKGRPVKMTWTREEDMTHDFPRPMQLGRMAGVVRDGKVAACDIVTVGQSPARSWLGRIAEAPPKPDVLVLAGAWDQPMRIPNYRVTGYAPEGLPPVTTHRAPGANANGFFHECFLDELLLAAGLDPLEGRLALCHHEASRGVLEAVATLSDWGGTDIGPNRGRGVAFVLSHGVPVAEVVDVTLTDRGIRVDDVFVAVDAGTVLDPKNFEAQVTGGVVWGLGHAMNAELTYEDHAPVQTNFHAYEYMRLYQTPRIRFVALEDNFKIRGIGEPTVSPAAPALANAIFAATGKRIRELPLGKHVDFV